MNEKIYKYHTHPESLYGWDIPHGPSEDKTKWTERITWRAKGLPTRYHGPADYDYYSEHWMVEGKGVAFYSCRHKLLSLKDYEDISKDESMYPIYNQVRKNAVAYYSNIEGMRVLYGEDYYGTKSEKIKREMGID